MVMKCMIEFKKDKYGFWRQSNPERFSYDESYKSNQRTTPEMSWCRLGFLASKISPDKMKCWKVCDIGSGNGVFANEASRFFKEGVKEYDLSGNSISKEELEITEWDLIFLTDVLEHFEDIDDLFKIHFRYAFISFPETPEVNDFHELQSWRHFKPNEHIYCLNLKGMIKWLNSHSYASITYGNPEDMIRASSDGRVNISTIIASRIRS